MDFKTLVGVIITSVFTPITFLIVALATIYFLLGVLKYIQSVGDETKRKEGVTMMTYGIIGLFVMASLWGLVYVLQSTFPGLGSGTPIKPPSLTGSNAPSSNSNNRYVPTYTPTAGMEQPF